MPITPATRPSCSAIQNATPLAISRASSSAGMYGSCQRSAGITPRYARAASLMTAVIAGKSDSALCRMSICLGASWLISVERLHTNLPSVSYARHGEQMCADTEERRLGFERGEGGEQHRTALGVGETILEI